MVGFAPPLDRFGCGHSLGRMDAFSTVDGMALLSRRPFGSVVGMVVAGSAVGKSGLQGRREKN